MVLGQTLLNLWYWTLDQAIVQRVLAARSVEQARGGCLLAGYLKATPFFVMVVPGIMARRLYSSELHPDGRLQSNLALPVLMKRLLPHGVLGLMLAATLAACMSSLDSVFTAAGSLFCLDIYRPYFRPGATEREFVLIGRLLCVLLGIVTLLWIPVMSTLSDQIFVYLQSVSSYFAPPAVAVYYAGVLWRRANSQGAAAAFIVGYVLCLGRLVGEVVYKSLGGSTNPAASPGAIAARLLFGSQFLNACFAIFCCSMLALVVGSLRSPPPTQEQLRGLTIYRSQEHSDTSHTCECCKCWRSLFCCRRPLSSCKRKIGDDTEAGGAAEVATAAGTVAATVARFEVLERSGHSTASWASNLSLGGEASGAACWPTSRTAAIAMCGSPSSPEGSTSSSLRTSPRSSNSLCRQLSLNPDMGSSLWQRVREELGESGGVPVIAKLFDSLDVPSPKIDAPSPAVRPREELPPSWAIELDWRLRLLGLAAVQESIDSLVCPHGLQSEPSDGAGRAEGELFEEDSKRLHKINVFFTIGLVLLMGTLIAYWA